MADISGLYSEDHGKDDEVEGLLPYSDLCDETMDPLERILKYSNSDVKEHRVFIAKDLGSMASTLGVDMTMSHILPVIHHLHDDADVSVREKIAEQLPIVAMCIAEQAQVDQDQDYRALAVELTLPYALGMLTDHAQVRCVALTSVVKLMPLLSKGQIEDEIFTVIEQLVGENTKEEYRMQALELILSVSKHIHVEERDKLAHKLVGMLQLLSTDSMFRVRKSVALHLGVMAKVCGCTVTSEGILPLYMQLCSDEIWHVRKACAEVLMDVSEALPAATRLAMVPPLFFNFADDQIRWVRLAVYEILGQLIYTFRGVDATVAARYDHAHGSAHKDESAPVALNPNTDYSPHGPAGPATLAVAAETSSSFVASVYWNEPLVDIDHLVEEMVISDHCSGAGAGGPDVPAQQPHVPPPVPEDTRKTEADPNAAPGAGGEGDSMVAVVAGDDRKPSHEVPLELTKRFVEMASEELSRSVDSEIRLHCAYNFPAVIVTLGHECWATVRSAYITLCHDLDAKVRRTLAHSIHEVAQMLPVADIKQDLVPLFNLFLKDIVQVRFGVMKNFAKFMSVLDREVQARYLDLITNIDDMEIVDDADGASNWRFREVLANELVPISRLYNAHAVETLFPLCLSLMQDSVSVVRMVAYKSVAELLSRMEKENPVMAESLARKIKSHFTCAKCFRGRQMFVEICRHLCTAINRNLFVSLFVPELIELASDPVPNVRLAVADAIASTVMASGEFVVHAGLEAAVDKLRGDCDFDVRFKVMLTECGS